MKKETSGATLMKTKSSGAGVVSFLRRLRSPEICYDMKIMTVRNYNGHLKKNTKIQELTELDK